MHQLGINIVVFGSETITFRKSRWNPRDRESSFKYLKHFLSEHGEEPDFQDVSKCHFINFVAKEFAPYQIWQDTVPIEQSAYTKHYWDSDCNQADSRKLEFRNWNCSAAKFTKASSIGGSNGDFYLLKAKQTRHAAMNSKLLNKPL